MSDFKKPTTEFVSASNYIQELVNSALRKDLHDNEEICAHCHGTGMEIGNNIYGLSDDPDRIAGRFPYQHQALTFCKHCYNGVVRRCKLCGEIMPRGCLKHDCQKQKNINQIEWDFKRSERLHKAIKLTPEEYEERYPGHMVYHNDYCYSDVYDLLERLWDSNEYSEEGLPTFCVGTEKVTMKLDAASIIDQAQDDTDCEDLEFDTNGVKELSAFLETWNAKYSRDYYFLNEDVVIIIPEDIRKEVCGG